jgi:hypothetical protein
VRLWEREVTEFYVILALCARDHVQHLPMFYLLLSAEDSMAFSLAASCSTVNGLPCARKMLGMDEEDMM